MDGYGLVSIIVPVYNVEYYLERCVQSLINQTYENIEIILVDDESTDRSTDICRQLAAQDDRIRVIHKKNGGLSSARNAGIKASRGEYIGFVDSDDYVDHRMFEVLVNDIRMYDADISQCGCEIIWENRIEYRNGTGKLYLWNKKQSLIELFSASLIETSVWDKLYKREVLEGVSFDERIRLGEDFPFNAEVFAKIHRSVFRDLTLYKYRKRVGSLTGKGLGKPVIHTIITMKEILRKLRGEDPEVIEQGVVCLCQIYISVYNHSMYGTEDFSDLRRKIRKALKHYEVGMYRSKRCPAQVKIAIFLIRHFPKVYVLLERGLRMVVSRGRKYNDDRKTEAV